MAALKTWLTAGVVATAALGKEPAYAPARVARRLFGTRRLGPLLRWTYGPALGALYGALRSRFRIPAVAFGVAVAAGESFAMPKVGALPRLHGRERVALFLHAIAFALAAEAALRQARSASPSAMTV